ncbi:MAG: Lrp/AsnC family transcriptional regulator [Dehalococcoidia bacterium]|nr:Lrp/AsnC family transcriptional regulator [Dehalococcoidia bacterium]
MDELDARIIKVLQTDGRASNSHISREVGVSEGTVRRRLHHLVKDDVIKVVAIPNLDQMGYGTAALVGIRTHPASVEAIADSLSDLEDIQYVSITTGAWDIFIWVRAQSTEELGAFLRNQIAVIPGVMQTETFINLFIKKRPYGMAM